MTAQEKANSLINKFMDYADIDCDDDGFPMVTSQIRNAKQCAIILVDEIMIYASALDSYQSPFYEPDDIRNVDYLLQVKDEILKFQQH